MPKASNQFVLAHSLLTAEHSSHSEKVNLAWKIYTTPVDEKRIV
jgi:hypothetical protein